MEDLNNKLAMRCPEELKKTFGHLDSEHNVNAAISHNLMGSLIRINDYELYVRMVK